MAKTIATAKLVAGLRACRRLDETMAMLRREGFVLDDLADRWQKLAFSLYTTIVEIDRLASETLQED